jgi:hypothetical protein
MQISYASFVFLNVLVKSRGTERTRRGTMGTKGLLKTDSVKMK